MTKLIVTDGCFASLRDRPFADRVALVRAAGFSALSVSIYDERTASEFPELLKALDRGNVGLASLAVQADVSNGRWSVPLDALLPSLQGRPVRIELILSGSGTYDVPSAPRADGRAIELIRAASQAADGSGLTLSLSHRRGVWMERIEDAVRLLMRINQDDLGVIFSLPDWLAVDGTNFESRLHLALPRLTNLIVGEATDESRVAVARAEELGYAGPMTVDVRDAALLASGVKDWTKVRR